LYLIIFCVDSREWPQKISINSQETTGIKTPTQMERTKRELLCKVRKSSARRKRRQTAGFLRDD
jgi:hypothetical protein